MRTFVDSKSRHISKKVRKFNKRKHLKEKEMTREHLAHIVNKKLYVEWKTTSVTHVHYDRNKQRLKEPEKEHSKKYEMPKNLILTEFLQSIKLILKRPGKPLMKH